MKTAVIMSRVSTDEQAKTGYSLDIQEKALSDYCAQNHIKVVMKIREDHSAKNFDRPEYKKYLEFSKRNKNKVDYLLVTTWDRFSRNTTDSYEMIRRLKGYGIEVQAIQQPLDLSIPESKVLLAIYLTMPHVDNERRSIKVKEGMRAAIKAGRWTGMAPRGYRNGRDENNKPMLYQTDEAMHFKYAFEEFAKGTKSQVQILDELSHRGVTIRKNTFSLMLRNPLYCGKLRARAFKDEPEYLVDGKHEAIISQETFIKVQDLLVEYRKETKHPRYHTRREELPLRGFLLCNECGEKMTGSASKSRNGDRHFYYHCNHCRTTRYRAGDVNDSVVKMLKSLSVSSEVEELFKVIVQLVFNEDQISDAKEKELATKKLDQLNEQIERLDDLLLGGKLKIEDYNSMKEKLSNRLNQLKSKQQIKETEKSEFEEYLFKGVGLLKNFGSAYENYDLDGKYQLLGSTFPEKIIFDGKKCRTTKMNEAVSLIVSVDKGLKKSKKKQADKNIDLFTIVGPTGFEPVTPCL